jgi:hypothetical protein
MPAGKTPMEDVKKREKHKSAAGFFISGYRLRQKESRERGLMSTLHRACAVLRYFL